MSADPAFIEETLDFAERMIAIPSVTGDEGAVLRFLSEHLAGWGWNVEQIPVEENRYNLFVTFGTPRIVFTTHVDVVPAPAHLFFPRRQDGRLYGRGACDAKGIAAAMAGACRRLLQRGANNFGYLLVVGEERDGIGARTAAKVLRGRGIEYIVNGEPTELKMMEAHKGSMRVRIECEGRAAHSGYPSQGEDANAKLIRIATRLMAADFGTDPVLGASTVNVGLIRGGTAPNVISPGGYLECVIRFVGEDEAAMLAKVDEIVGEDGTVTETSMMALARLMTLPGFDTNVASYGTDVPYYFPLTTECILYGPGTIDVAHTENEHIEIADLEQSVEDYCSIFERLG